MRGKTEIAKQRQADRQKPSQSDSGGKIRRNRHRFLAAALAPGLALATAGPVGATIDNIATASGSYGTQLVQTDAAILNLPVEPARPAMTVAQIGVLDVSGGEDGENADAGDTISYTVTVTNSGDVTLHDVRPSDGALTANGTAGTGSFAAFEPATVDSLAPGKSQAFKAVYTLSAEDVYRAAGQAAGIATNFAATGKGAGDAIAAEPVAGTVEIDANPRLEIAKTSATSKGDGNTGEALEAGDLVTYTYTVSNTGNVAITGIAISDEHEGKVLNSAELASADEGPFDETVASADPLGVNADDGANGSWDLLGAGGSVTFTYRHIVTQEEFEAQ